MCISPTKGLDYLVPQLHSLKLLEQLVIYSSLLVGYQWHVLLNCRVNWTVVLMPALLHQHSGGAGSLRRRAKEQRFVNRRYCLSLEQHRRAVMLSLTHCLAFQSFCRLAMAGIRTGLVLIFHYRFMVCGAIDTGILDSSKTCTTRRYFVLLLVYFWSYIKTEIAVFVLC